MQIKSHTIPLPIENIDTDQIIPARFLKGVDKQGYGKHLFSNWRYNNDDNPNADFILNAPDRQGAQIIVAGNNFGCGSSREHAAWAIADYGIKAIVSTQFADIFKGNAFNNGILPIELNKKCVDELMKASASIPSLQVSIDLEKQEIVARSINFCEQFEIDPFRKKCLLEGVDETDYLVNRREKIEAFEISRRNVNELNVL